MDEQGARSGSRAELDPGGGVVDLISTLPDDLLLQVLERLVSDAAAARTSILSRRWRGLWSGLPKVTVTLHDVPFDSLQPALRRVARPGVCHFLLDIRVPGLDRRVSGSRVTSLLHDAARLSPAELRFTLPRNLKVSWVDAEAELPCFHRATSIELQARDLHLSQIMGRGSFHSLERLSLSGCNIDLATFIPRCPRLRLLRLNTTDLVDMGIITIHSASLEELVFEHKNRWTGLSRISVQAPMLKQLTMSFHARSDLGVSILAPMVEKDSCSFPNAELSFVAEMDKHMVTNFSSLDLHLRTKGHVFGAIVLYLLGLDRIRKAIWNLKIVLLGSEVKDACPADCLCDEPKDWRTQSIFLAGLQKVEIEGVKGEDHELDFLKVIFRGAPTLRRVALELSDEATPSDDWRTKTNDIIKAYPPVEYTVGLVSGKQF
ncbi:hypothetical protein ACQ4PT_012965 [Festuca glaucescens]